MDSETLIVHLIGKDRRAIDALGAKLKLKKPERIISKALEIALKASTTQGSRAQPKIVVRVKGGTGTQNVFDAPTIMPGGGNQRWFSRNLGKLRHSSDRLPGAFGKK